MQNSQLSYSSQDILKVEDVLFSDIAKQFGTPTYVYSHQVLQSAFQELKNALEVHQHQIYYAVKANSNLNLLKLLSDWGSGFDIVSQGELEKVLKVGADPKKIIFSGVGKSESEIHRALTVGIGCFNVESLPELARIDRIATHLNTKAPISVRLNPNIEAQTHPYIATGLKENKFGLEWDAALESYRTAKRSAHLKILGLTCHIGSQILSLEPFLASCDLLLAAAKRLEEEGIKIEHLDVGGGLGIAYHEETAPSLTEYGRAIAQKFSSTPYTLFLEPGRSLVANAGTLLTRCEYVKQTAHKQFAIVDAGMADLLRPALYQAWHPVVPVHKSSKQMSCRYDIVGPLCETGDFLAQDRVFSSPIEEGDLLCVLKAGAYGFVMSNQYNGHLRAAEVLVQGGTATLVREKEQWADLWHRETIKSQK